MKTNTFKVRGYEGIRHLEFDKDDMTKLAEILGVERTIMALNTAEISHNWNSAFETALCEAAEKAGHVRQVVKDDDGKITDRESNSGFLKRTKFTLGQVEAQALADSIPFPVVSKPRSPKEDKEAVERLQLAQTLYGDAERLERFRAKVKLVAPEVAWPDFNGESTEDEDVVMLAEVIRQYRLAI